MKTNAYTIAWQSLILCFLALTPIVTIKGQDFQRAYGTTFNNSFTKVIQDGSNYYVLGQDEPSGGALLRATVTCLNANGIHQWTLSLNIPSVWNDAVLTPTGDLLVVGATLPLDATNKSLIGLVTKAGGGNFTWVRSYDVSGRENLSRIVKSPSPQNPSFPYYILGSQWDPTNGSATWDDVILMNINAAGTFNWKKIFNGTDDDEFSRDLEVLNNGDLILAGNMGTQGVFIKTDNSVTLITGGTPAALTFTYADIAQESGGGIYAVGTTFPGFLAHFFKYDNNLFPVWEATISGLTAITQVWEESSSSDIYVTGRGVFNGVSRGVLLRFTDAGTAPSLQWVKYLDNGETSYQGQSSGLLSSNKISFVDGRNPTTGGQGQQDAFMSVSDLQLTTCMTSEDFVDVESISLLYNGPNLPPIEFFDFPTGTDLASSALNWQQEEVCTNDPCQADFIITPLDACGHIQVTNTSTGVLPLTYTWCNGSSSENLDVQLPCGLHTFCLTITDATGCTSSYMEDVTVSDNVPPVALCQPPFGITLDSNCTYTLNPAQIDAGSFDNCQILSISISPAVLTGCGIFLVTLTVTDWCGNKSTCTTTVQAHENVPPKITCPQDLTVNTDPGQCFYSGPIPLPTAKDNCNPNPDVNCYLVTSSGGLIPITSQTVFPKGENTICCVADDGCVDVSKIICTYPCSSPIPFNGDPLSLRKIGADTEDVVPEEASSLLDVQPGISADVLVKDIFVGGNCFDISNITSFGDPSQLGTFSNGLTNIGFASGVILATGPCVYAIGPNDDDGKGNISGTITPDADLSTLTTGVIIDKASLEFDFIPTQTPISFGFVFAAEEYCEFVGSTFNDVIGFFISGPGISGQQNIAVLPSTTTPISVNTVNHLLNTGLYVNNQPATSVNLCGQIPSTSPAVTELQYDGFTRKFIAVANVVPGQTYHLKIAIADVIDNLRDAAVFLNAGSFDAGGNVATEWLVNSKPVSDTAYENCGTVNLVFSRVGGNIAIPVTVPFTISGTAIAGADYGTFASSVVIPANQTQFILPVTIFNDAVIEGDETIIITVDPICSFLKPHAILTIKDHSLLQAKCTYTVTVIDNEPPIIICPPDLTITGTINPDGLCTALVTNLTPITSDNCPMLMVDYTITGATITTGVNDASGTTFLGGTSLVTYVATDMGGNIATCSISVTVFCPNPCDTFAIVLNTGWDNQNTTIFPIGGIDNDTKLNLDWIVTSDPKNPPSPSGRPANVILGHFLWATPFTNSQWIAPSPTGYQGTLSNNGTPFTLQCNFDLPSGYYNPNLTLQMRADERIDSVFLNNNMIYAFSPPQVDGGFSGPPLIVSTNNASFFHPLQNNLTIDYRDVSGDLTGFNLEGTVTYGICDTCQCGTFSDMAIRFERGPGQPLTCGEPPVLIECPPPGYSYTITGKFECQGTGCPPNTPFDSQLQLPDGTIITLASQSANPYFAIPISNLDLQQAGIYTVTFTGHCGTQECKCVIKFQIDSPCIDICPCNPGDIQAFSAAVNQGFAQVLSSNSCKACFSPTALADCETVEWYLTNTGGTPIGTSTANNSFCYIFPGSGTYTVIMVATRKKDDGTNCETFTKTQTVSISCFNQTECTTSVFPNPTFSEGAVAGGLDSGGHSDGWKANSGNPKLNEGQIESFDGWTILLSGNLDTADVLSSQEPICLEKSTGIIQIRLRKEVLETKNSRKASRIAVQLYQEDNFEFSGCTGINCYQLAAVPLDDADSIGWFEIQIPYDLSNWEAFDTCGGKLVRSAVFVTNALSTSQGGAGTYSYVQLDNFCFDGTLVAVEEPGQKHSVQIYPNPTTGELIINFVESTPKECTMQIVDLYGRFMQEKKLEIGHSLQTLSIEALSPGIYFVKITERGFPIWIEKVIKQ